MTSISKFFNEDANLIFDKLYKIYEKDEVDSWKFDLEKIVNYFFEKYNVISYLVNKNSYMGLVLICSTKKNNIIIKVVPPMTNRFFYETKTLQLLNHNLVCEIYEIDSKRNTIVMEKIEPGLQLEFNYNNSILKKLFECLYENKINITEEIDNNFLDFSDVVKRDYEMCIKLGKNNSFIDLLYSKFNNIYTEVCEKEKKYLLHGDVYKNNILLKNNTAKIIDPLGFKAPFIMELVSICAYYMFNNPDMDTEEIISEFCIFFNNCDVKKYKKALFCQLVKVYIPSIYEANDCGERSNRWLEIIKKIYKNKI